MSPVRDSILSFYYAYGVVNLGSGVFDNSRSLLISLTGDTQVPMVVQLSLAFSECCKQMVTLRAMLFCYKVEYLYEASYIR